MEHNCASYNLMRRSEAEGHICELNNSTHEGNENNLEENPKYVYRGTKSACVSNPCANNSTCQTGFTDKGYRCLCTAGFEGHECQNDINECNTLTHDCSADALCDNTKGSYNCYCKSGYSGDGRTCDGESTYSYICESIVLFSQNWYAVCSIIENTLEALKKEHPHITQVNFRSDEAGCYYNNFLVAAVRDAGNRVGITVTRYDFSEPQYGKDVSDRILCPMKSAIRRYCNEGHDVLSAKDMRTALSERPVRGTTASVCSVNESQKTLEVKMTDHFSRCRLFPVKEARIHNATSTDGEETSGLFSCPEPGCQMVFKKVSELENHLDVGEHRQMRGGSETVYDKLRRDWAEKFLNVDNNEGSSSAPVAHCDERGDEFEYQAPSFCSDLQLGLALHKARNQGVRFPDDVKQYLTRKFDLGERTGEKADPGKVAADMRTARRPDGLRIFDRLAATRRKQGNQELQMEDVYAEEEEEERREVLESVAAELSPRHPICYDSYCLCDLARDESLDSFSVVMLKVAGDMTA
ncbi:hypothetical protein ACROYT_G041192 [Oculina patagonica]